MAKYDFNPQQQQGNISTTNITSGSISYPWSPTTNAPASHQPSNLFDPNKIVEVLFRGIQVEGLDEYALQLGVEGRDNMAEGQLFVRGTSGAYYNIMELVSAHLALMLKNPEIIYRLNLTPLAPDD